MGGRPKENQTGGTGTGVVGHRCRVLFLSVTPAADVITRTEDSFRHVARNKYTARCPTGVKYEWKSCVPMGQKYDQKKLR